MSNSTNQQPPLPKAKKEIVNKKYLFIFIGYFAVIIIYTYIKVFIESHQEYNTKYDFVIKEIETGAKGELTFHDSFNNEYFFASYSFNRHDNLGIEAGDRLFKDYRSENMIFSRMTDDGYKTYYVQKPNGMVPFSLYSY